MISEHLWLACTQNPGQTTRAQGPSSNVAVLILRERWDRPPHPGVLYPNSIAPTDSAGLTPS